MIVLPFQNNTNFGAADTRRVNNTFLIQPVVPVNLSDDLSLVSRAIIPVVRQPIGTDDSVNGLGDINYSAFFVPGNTKGFTIGVGPAFSFPSEANSRSGNGKWAAGPTVVALAMPGEWVVGALYCATGRMGNSIGERLAAPAGAVNRFAERPDGSG